MTGFCFSWFWIGNFEYLCSIVIACYHEVVPIFVVEKIVVVFILVVGNSCKVRKYLVEEYHLVDL